MNKYERFYAVMVIANRTENNSAAINSAKKFVKAYSKNINGGKDGLSLVRSIMTNSDVLREKLASMTNQEKDNHEGLSKLIYQNIAYIGRSIQGIYDSIGDVEKYAVIENAILAAYPSDDSCPDNEELKSILTNIFNADIDEIIHRPGLVNLAALTESLELFVHSVDTIHVDKNIIYAILLLIICVRCLNARYGAADLTDDAKIPMTYEDVTWLFSMLIGKQNTLPLSQIPYVLIHEIMTSGNMVSTSADVGAIILKVRDLIYKIEQQPCNSMRSNVKLTKWLMFLLRTVSIAWDNGVDAVPSNMVNRLNEMAHPNYVVDIVMDPAFIVDECLGWCKQVISKMCVFQANTDSSENDGMTLNDGYITVIKDYYGQVAHQDIYCILALYKIAKNLWCHNRYLDTDPKPADSSVIDKNNAHFDNIYKAYTHLPTQIIDAINGLRFADCHEMKVNFQELTNSILRDIIEPFHDVVLLNKLKMKEVINFWVDGVTDINLDDTVHNVISTDIMKILALILDDAVSCGLQLSDEMTAECHRLISRCAMEVIRETHGRISTTVEALEMIRPIISRFYTRVKDSEE